MKTGMKALVSASIVSVMALGGSALAATKGKTASGYHCVNNKGQEMRAAQKASECKLPYHWIKAGATTASAKARAKGLTNAKKHKGHVAAAEKKTQNQ